MMENVFTCGIPNLRYYFFVNFKLSWLLFYIHVFMDNKQVLKFCVRPL